MTFLHSGRRNSRYNHTVLVDKRNHVADGKSVFETGYAQIGQNFHATSAVEWDAQRFGQWASANTGRPNDIFRANRTGGCLDTALGNRGNTGIGSYFNAHALKLMLAAGGQFQGQMRQNNRARFNEHD